MPTTPFPVGDTADDGPPWPYSAGTGCPLREASRAGGVGVRRSRPPSPGRAQTACPTSGRLTPVKRLRQYGFFMADTITCPVRLLGACTKRPSPM